ALSWPKLVLAPFLNGGRVRIISPLGASILITSAPRSASKRVQCGPAIVVVKSSTRRPDKAPFIPFSSQAGVSWQGSGAGQKCQDVSVNRADMRLAFAWVRCQESRDISREGQSWRFVTYRPE